MKLFIPSLGTKLVLNHEWTFTLYSERRNTSLGVATGHYDGKGIWSDRRTDWGHKVDEQGNVIDTPYNERVFCRPIAQVTLPAGTELTVDRIFIRQGMNEFNSVSFYIGDAPKTAMGFKKMGKIRFWAKLDEVNTIDCYLAKNP